MNQWAYNNMDWYQNRVDAHPDRYSPPGARIWDLRARMDDFTDAVRGGTDASAANRALRIGGPLGTVVGFGVGIGVSWLLEETGAADVVKDVAEDAWDSVSDGVSDAWDSIFG